MIAAVPDAMEADPRTEGAAYADAIQHTIDVITRPAPPSTRRRGRRGVVGGGLRHGGYGARHG